MMDESRKKARLKEIGKEIAEMFPERVGSITFDMVKGRFTGVREENNWRVKQ